MSYYNDDLGWLGAFMSCLAVIIFCIIFGAIGGLLFMLLWNWLAPLFWANAPELSFLQAWGTIVLISWIGSFFRSSKSK